MIIQASDIIAFIREIPEVVAIGLSPTLKKLVFPTDRIAIGVPGGSRWFDVIAEPIVRQDNSVTLYTKDRSIVVSSAAIAARDLTVVETIRAELLTTR